MKINVKEITISGIITSLTIVLGATGLGFIPVPSLAGAATLMHIPVILAGTVASPVAAVLSGLAFGFFSFNYLGDVRVVFPARILMGLGVFVVYRAFHKKKWSIPIASAVGSLINTVGTLLLAVVFGYIPSQGANGAVSIAIINGIPELLLACIIITPVTIAIEKIRK